ncbi:MAG: rhomboid family intramembrane serine protease [Acidobacteriota bacterium]|nr:MAG: rhomboid family intramembrane serine protease [Acidobacteriota bacterium]
MLFPIGDDNTQRTIVPLVTYTLIAINVVVYFLLQSSEAFTYGYSVVPAEITRGEDLDTVVRIGGQALRLYPGPAPVYLTLFSAMFMHGGIGHLFGNMLYLWIFGDNVEDSMGHGKFLTFYLICGVLASAAHIFFAPNSIVPSLGASGAIAGVLGAYLVLYPRQGIRVLYWGRIVEMPAIMVIGFWGFLQFLSGFGSLAQAGEQGGVAYMAHVGGFVAGLGLVFLFRGRKEVRRPGHFE